MIQFSLKCAEGHTFDSWFQSGDAFDKLHRTGMVSCAICGSTSVDKAMMAPRVTPTDKAVAKDIDAAAQNPIAQMRKYVEENSDYVGKDFATEAMAMHLGTAPERSIYGEARPDEAKKLIEEGVPVMPLPFLPKQKTN